MSSQVKNASSDATMKAISSTLLLFILPLLLHAVTPGAGSVIESDTPSEESLKPLRPVFAAYTFEIGSARLADTYLTPLHYNGWHSAIDYMRQQAAPFTPERWAMRLNAHLDLGHTENPARNATMWNALLTFDWALLHRWHSPISAAPSLTLAAGPAVTLQGGCLYLSRNGNNPVAARGSLTLGATGYAAYPLSIGRLPVTLIYQPSLPLTGVFFSPDYGELYYEIYLGNRSGLAHAAWPGNYRRFNHLLTADIHLGATNIRIGYRGDYFSSRVSGITSRSFTHTLVIGLSGEWLSYNPRRPRSASAPVISPIF